MASRLETVSATRRQPCEQGNGGGEKVLRAQGPATLRSHLHVVGRWWGGLRGLCLLLPGSAGPHHRCRSSSHKRHIARSLHVCRRFRKRMRGSPRWARRGLCCANVSCPPSESAHAPTARKGSQARASKIAAARKTYAGRATLADQRALSHDQTSCCWGIAKAASGVGNGGAARAGTAGSSGCCRPPPAARRRRVAAPAATSVRLPMRSRLQDRSMMQRAAAQLGQSFNSAGIVLFARIAAVRRRLSVLPPLPSPPPSPAARTCHRCKRPVTRACLPPVCVQAYYGAACAAAGRASAGAAAPGSV